MAPGLSLQYESPPMKYILFHTTGNLSPFFLRIALGGIILFHGVSRLGPDLGAFIDSFPRELGMPAALGWLTVLIETLGCVLLIIGFATRINAFLLFSLFAGIIITAHWQDGFLMNWYGQLEPGHEGYEYHLLVLAMCVSLILEGGGKWSVDKMLSVSKE